MAAAVLLIGGCGDPRQVTYVDPNGPRSPVRGGDGGEPFLRHGAAAVERARACIAVRGTLAVARTLAVNDRDGASTLLDRTLGDDLPMLESRARANAPEAAIQLRTGIEALRDQPPTNIADYNVAVRRLSEELLVDVCDVVVPAEARQDIAFRAGMLSETLLAAATAYEEAFEGSRRVRQAEYYQRAYGLLIDASTRQLEAVPQDARPRIRQTLDGISRRATPGPTPPDRPHHPDLIVGDLSTLADDVVIATRIDPSYPLTTQETADRLRSLKLSIATAVEAYERGSVQDALETLRVADRTMLVPAASGVAAVTPSLLADLERDLLVVLPETIAQGGDLVTVATATDALVDEAVSLVEEELMALRETG
jgi:hypothetical protein